MTTRYAVVTGAAHGIGRASALRLAAEGYELALLDVEGDALSAVAADIARGGRVPRSFVADTRDEDRVRAVFAEIEAAGPVDVLFNNVGQSAREKATEFWRSDPATWRFVWEVCVISTMHCARQVVPGMRERRRGRIINMSSDSALIGDAGLADYAAAKMGILGFTRALARELAPHGVTVNAVAPGAIRTRAHDRLPAATVERIKASVPAGYVGEPEDVAHAVAFLASEGAHYITGQTLLIDGGRWMV